MSVSPDLFELDKLRFLTNNKLSNKFIKHQNLMSDKQSLI